MLIKQILSERNGGKSHKGLAELFFLLVPLKELPLPVSPHGDFKAEGVMRL